MGTLYLLTYVAAPWWQFALAILWFVAWFAFVGWLLRKWGKP